MSAMKPRQRRTHHWSGREGRAAQFKAVRGTNGGREEAGDPTPRLQVP